MNLFRRLLRKSTGAPPPLRTLALGSCRVHDPLSAMHALDQIYYLNSDIESSSSSYLHDVHEMIQFLQLLKGMISMPAVIVPFAFRNWRPAAQVATIGRAERLVTEVCTDKHYEAMGYTLNINEIHRQLVEPAGEPGHLWWNDAHQGDSAPADVILSVEAELMRRGRLTKAHSQILHEITLVTLTTTAMTEALGKLRSLIPCPILVMPHIAVHREDGTSLAERKVHIGKTIEAAHHCGLRVLDPELFIARDKQECVLADGGRDLHHYAADYLPTVGFEIVQALRSF